MRDRNILAAARAALKSANEPTTLEGWRASADRERCIASVCTATQCRYTNAADVLDEIVAARIGTSAPVAATARPAPTSDPLASVGANALGIFRELTSKGVSVSYTRCLDAASGDVQARREVLELARNADGSNEPNEAA